MKLTKIKNKECDEYCGRCLVCRSVKKGKSIKNKIYNKLPKIYRMMYEERICFTTRNKISRDKRYKNNIRTERKYTKRE